MSQLSAAAASACTVLEQVQSHDAQALALGWKAGLRIVDAELSDTSRPLAERVRRARAAIGLLLNPPSTSANPGATASAPALPAPPQSQHPASTSSTPSTAEGEEHHRAGPAGERGEERP